VTWRRLRAAPAEIGLRATVRGRCRPESTLLLLSLKALPDKESSACYSPVRHGRTAFGAPPVVRWRAGLSTHADYESACERDTVLAGRLAESS